MENIHSHNSAEAIHRLSLQSSNKATHQYITSLEDSTIAKLNVAIQAALHYLSVCNIHLAASAIQKALSVDWFEDENALLTIEVSCLALLNARVESLRDCRYVEAQKLANRVESIFSGTALPANFVLSEDLEHKYVRIATQASIWKLDDSSQFEVYKGLFSETRCLLEMILLQIRLDGVDFGIQSPNEIYSQYRDRFLKTVKIMRSQKYYLSEASLVLGVPKLERLIGSEVLACKFLYDYLNSIGEDDLYFIRAAVHNRVCYILYPTSPSQAREHLEKGIALNRKYNNPTGLLVSRLLRLYLFWDTSNSLYQIEALSQLAREYLKDDDLLQSYTSLLSASQRPQNRNTWATLGPLCDEIEVKCTQLGWSLGRSLIKVRCRLNVLCSISDFRDYGRRLCEENLDNSDKIQALPPCLRREVHFLLADCYNALNDNDMRINQLESIVLIDITCSSDELKSQSRSDLGWARISSIQAQIEHIQTSMHNQSNKTERLEVIRHRILTEIYSLEQLIYIDKVNGHTELFINKERAIFALYGLLFIFYRDPSIVSKIHSAFKDLQSLSDPESQVRQIVGFSQLVQEARSGDVISDSLSTLENISQPKSGSRNISPDLYWILFLEAQANDFQHPDMLTCDRSLSLTKQWEFLRKDLSIRKDFGDWIGIAARVPELLGLLLRRIKNDPSLQNVIEVEGGQMLLDAEQGFENIRRRIVKEEKFSMLTRKRTISANAYVRQLYVYAAIFYVRLSNLTAAWDWLQRSRSRSLLDVLSTSSSKLPGDALSTSMSGVAMFETEAASLTEKTKLLPLESLTSLAGGFTPVGLDELDEIWTLAESLPRGSKLVLVDWIIFPGVSTPTHVHPRPSIYILVADSNSKAVKCQEIEISLKTVREWMDTYLSFVQEDEPTPWLSRDLGAMKQLSPLIEPLSSFSDPEDLLVLIPPSHFSSLPLHAIPLATEQVVLIERNPIVYSSSVSLYQRCLKRVQDIRSHTGRAMSHAQFLAAYRQGTERERIFDNLKRISGVFECASVEAEDVTKSKFEIALQSSPWIHYHGHVAFEDSDALNQKFILGSSESSEVKQTDISKESVLIDPNLSALEIFQLSLTKVCPTIVAIACSSNLQDVAAGEEPLGLVSAFLVAGAGSIIGTLWPIRSKDGRKFSEELYSNVAEQLKDLSNGSNSTSGKLMINLATAVRSAARAMKAARDTRYPYSWAAFAVYGAGIHSFDSVSINVPKEQSISVDTLESTRGFIREETTREKSVRRSDLTPQNPLLVDTRINPTGFIIPSSQFRRLVEQNDNHSYMFDSQSYVGNSHVAIEGALGEYSQETRALIRLDGLESKLWACDLSAAFRLSLNLRYVQHNIPKGQYRIVWHFAYVYKVTMFNKGEIDWSKQHQSDITMISGTPVDERIFMSRTTDRNSEWISNNLDDIIEPSNRALTQTKVPFIDFEHLGWQRVIGDCIGARVRFSAPAVINVPKNGTLGFMLRKVGGGPTANGWLYLFGVELTIMNSDFI